MTKRRILLAAVVVTVAIASVLAMPKALLVSADSQNFQVKVVKSDFTGWADVSVEVWGEGQLWLTSGKTDANGDVFFNLPAGGWYEFRAGDASTIALVPSAFPTAALVGVVLMPSRQTQYQLTISVSPPDTGTTNPAVGSHWYDSGSSVVVTAMPASGFVLHYWILDGTTADSSNPITIVMNDPHALEAHFLFPVNIDIKPGSFPNAVNPNSKGVIPVAILGSTTLDVHSVDVSSLRFGPNGAPVVQYAFEDVNGDGYVDLVLHFKTQATGIKPGDAQACPIGTATINGIPLVPIKGCDSIVTVPS